MAKMIMRMYMYMCNKAEDRCVMRFACLGRDALRP